MQRRSPPPPVAAHDQRARPRTGAADDVQARPRRHARPRTDAARKAITASAPPPSSFDCRRQRGWSPVPPMRRPEYRRRPPRSTAAAPERTSLRSGGIVAAAAASQPRSARAASAALAPLALRLLLRPSGWGRVAPSPLCSSPGIPAPARGAGARPPRGCPPPPTKPRRRQLIATLTPHWNLGVVTVWLQPLTLVPSTTYENFHGGRCAAAVHNT